MPSNGSTAHLHHSLTSTVPLADARGWVACARRIILQPGNLSRTLLTMARYGIVEFIKNEQNSNPI